MFFKVLKQHLRIKSSVGASLNALQTQRRTALVAWIWMLQGYAWLQKHFSEYAA